jgi:N-methylhydantoinase A
VHQQNYSFNIDHQIELVNLRAVAIGVVSKVKAYRHEPERRSSLARPKHTAKIYCRGKPLLAALYDRNELRSGNTIVGPAVITQPDSTTMILPDCAGSVDSYLNILIWPKSNRATKTAAQAANGSRALKQKRTQNHAR